MNDGPLPTETEDLLAELAAIGSFTIAGRTQRDWTAIESALGTRLPSQYKAYAESFPGGQFRRLQVFHPEGSDQPRPHGLVEEVGWTAPSLRPTSPTAPYQMHPEPGGLIPWAGYEGDYFLCWLPKGEDPDSWPIIAYEDEDHNEAVEGSTLQALIRVIRGYAGRRVFPEEFWEFPATFIRAYDDDSDSPPDTPAAAAERE